jgi:hypothetical protein
MAACCACFTGTRPERSERSELEALAKPDEIFGNAACRRLSLSDLPRPSAAVLIAGSGGGGARSSSRSARGGSGFSVTAAAGSSTAGSRPPSFGGAEGSFEFNPLRRVSLPMQGAPVRPAEDLRRASMSFVPAARSSSGSLSGPLAAR